MTVGGMTSSIATKVAGAVSAAVLTVVLAGCSGDTGEPDPPAPLGTAEFRAAAASACTEVLNHRLYVRGDEYFEQRDVAFEAILLGMGRESDLDHEPEQISVAVAGMAAELTREADRLSLLRAADPGDQQAWDSIVQTLRDRADELLERTQAIEDKDYDRIRPTAVTGFPDGALEALLLHDRECGRLLT